MAKDILQKFKTTRIAHAAKLFVLKIEAIFWNIWLRFPVSGLKVIGVIGDTGATTTSSLIFEIINDTDMRAGVISTSGYGIPGNWRDTQNDLSNLRIKPLLKQIRELRREGIDWLVLEVSSVALAENKLWGVPFSVAVMTSLDKTNPEQHKTFVLKQAAMVKLFKLTADNSSGRKVGVVNADDPSAPYFANRMPNVWRYGRGKVDV